MIHFFGVDGSSSYPESECIWVLRARRYTRDFLNDPEPVMLGVFSTPEKALAQLGDLVMDWEEAPNQTWHGNGVGIAQDLYFELHPGKLDLVISAARLNDAVHELWARK